MEIHRIYSMSFARVYPLYIAKVERKGRTKKELNEAICWLTGYSQKELDAQLKKETDLEKFFAEAPKLNPLRNLITGIICGIRVEDIKEPTMQAIRYLDKLVDELAKGKPLEKILRKIPTEQTSTSSKPSTISEYIALQPKESQKKLSEMREAILSSAPGAVEGMKWGMPSFSYKRILVNFAGFKHHIGFYPTPSAIEHFAKQLTKYKTAKGSIQFPLAEPLPIPLIKKITAFRVKESKIYDKKWKTDKC